MATSLRIGDRGPAVKSLQVQVNRTLRERKFSFRTIDADEIFGEKTQRAASFAAWLMGFTRGQRDKIEEGLITARSFGFLVRETPKTDAMKRRTQARKSVAKKLLFLHNHPAETPAARGVGSFDGVPVAGWMVKFLKKSRANGWQGHVVSGFRSPEHSEKVCFDICGKPTCPGKCAGRTSNHVGLIHPAGAIDITDTVRFAAIQAKIGSPLRNDLPNDLVHFSVSGH